MFLVFAVLCLVEGPSTGYSLFNRTWGFDHLLFYPPVVSASLCIVLLLLLFPPVTQVLQRKLMLWASGLRVSQSLPNTRFLLVALLAAVLFYVLKVKYFFLGDFNLRMEQIMRGETIFTEYLTMKCLYGFAKACESIGLSHRSSFEIFSCLMGGIFVYTSCRIAWLLGEGTAFRLFLTAAQVLTPMVLVFCGYIEIYAMPYAALSVFLYMGLLYLKHKAGMVAVLISLAFAIACHILCAACVPALVVLWYCKHPNSFTFYRRRSPLTKTLLLLALVILGYALLLHSGNGFLIPLYDTPIDSPTFFSLPHGWELLNGQILSAGLFFFWVLYLSVSSLLRHTSLSTSLLFLLVTAGALLALISVLDLQRGSGDWDIMAIAAVPLQLGAVLLIRERYAKHMASYLLCSCLGIQGIQTALWIHTQHSDVSIQKIKSMLVSDPASYYKARMSGRFQLVALYYLNNLITEAQSEALIECNQKYLTDCRSCVMYAESKRKQGKKDEAAQFYESFLTKNPNIPEAYLYLYEYYNEKGDTTRLNRTLNSLFDAFLQNPDFFLRSSNVKPPIYQMFFEILFNEIYKTADKERVQRLYLTIETLKSINKQNSLPEAPR